MCHSQEIPALELAIRFGKGELTRDQYRNELKKIMEANARASKERREETERSLERMKNCFDQLVSLIEGVSPQG
jgi:hypothetical protein